jgi:hypothetical protein
MIITAGYLAKKEHLTNGSLTACNRRSSGIGVNEFQSFKWFAEKCPEVCCKKCLNRFNKKQTNH